MIVWVYLFFIKTLESPFLTFLPRSCLMSLKRRVYHCGKSEKGRKLLPETTRIAKESQTLEKKDLIWMTPCAMSVWWKLPLLHNWNRVTADPLKDIALRAGVTASSCQRDCTNFSLPAREQSWVSGHQHFVLKKILCTVHSVVVAKYSLSILSEQRRDDAVRKSTGIGGGLGKTVMAKLQKITAPRGRTVCFCHQQCL